MFNTASVVLVSVGSAPETELLMADELEVEEDAQVYEKQVTSSDIGTTEEATWVIVCEQLF